jgi:hypothetical protein
VWQLETVLIQGHLFGSVGEPAHLLGMNSDARNLRLRVTRREEPDVDRLVEWVLNIAEARHRAHLNGDPDPCDPDPCGLPPPEPVPPRGRSDKRAS